MSADDLLNRLRDVGCDHEPFTPGHSMCVCILTNRAADEIERLRHELAIAEHKSVEEGKRIGHAQVLRHVHQRLASLSTADECRADMDKLHKQYEAVHGIALNR